MEKNRRLIWDKQALAGLEKALEWISDSSVQQAEQVEQAIFDKIEIIRVHPERYPADKYKRNNQGSYRAFEAHRYRISYWFNEEEIRILMFRHTRQNPQEY